MHTPKQVDSLIHARTIIPVIPRNTCLHEHSLAINDGRILDILPTEKAIQLYTTANEYKLDKHALIPGLINAHGHTAMSLFRGLADDLPLMEWLNDHIWPAEGTWVNEEFVRDGSRLAIAEMIKSGTTFFSDMYFFPEETAKEAEAIGIKAQLCCPILDFPTAWGSGPEEYISKSLALFNEYKQHSLINIALGPHAPYTVSDTPLSNVRDIALNQGIPVQIHLHETQSEVDDAIKQNGQTPIERLSQLGLISQSIPLQCVHMTSLSDNDIEIISRSAAHVVHCPESNLKLASGFCETEKLLRAGVNIALGTDGAASNNDLDMLGEARTAALIAKPIAGDAKAIDAMTALELATINGAKALGVEEHTGSLEIGKCADVIAIKLDELNTQPCFSPISNIIYSASSTQVTHSWVNGKPLMEDRQLCNIDENKIIQIAQSWASKINQK